MSRLARPSVLERAQDMEPVRVSSEVLDRVNEAAAQMEPLAPEVEEELRGVILSID